MRIIFASLSSRPILQILNITHGFLANCWLVMFCDIRLDLLLSRFWHSLIPINSNSCWLRFIKSLEHCPLASSSLSMGNLLLDCFTSDHLVNYSIHCWEEQITFYFQFLLPFFCLQGQVKSPYRTNLSKFDHQ